MRIAPGAFSRVARSALRVSAESSIATAWRASSRATSSSSSTRAWAPRRRASAAIAAPRASAAAFRALPRWMSAADPALVDELPFELVQLQVVLGGPVEHRREPRPSVQLTCVPPRAGPLLRRLDHVLVEPPSGTVLLQPLAEPRPLAKERLVGHLDRALAHRHQPGFRQNVQHAGYVLIALRIELGEGDAAPHRSLTLARGQPKQDAAGDARLLSGQPTVGLLRQPGHRPPYPTGLRVSLHAYGSALAALPELEQRGGKQR